MVRGLPRAGLFPAYEKSHHEKLVAHFNFTANFADLRESIFIYSYSKADLRGEGAKSFSVDGCAEGVGVQTVGKEAVITRKNIKAVEDADI